MAKEKPNTKPKGKAATPFRKFEQLAKKLVRVPKGRLQELSTEKRLKQS